METNIYCCTRTGRTISEKTMEDGNITNTRENKIPSTNLGSIYNDRPAKLTANGHDFAGESSSPSADPCEQRRHNLDHSVDDKFRKRINPLRIHLGKRPYIDNSLQYYSTSKKKNKPNESIPRAPKVIPKHNNKDRSQFHNVTSQMDSCPIDNEKDKPVPRLVPKSQLHNYKKNKTEKGSQLKDYAQSLGLQPMVKFKCRKCCSMSFKTLAMLKEHQLVCRAQVNEPTLSQEATTAADSGPGGPSRVTRKVFLCSACGTYYENWNLFLHMREVHNRHICLFCLGMFSKAEKLSGHLVNKHNVQEFNYDSKEEFFKVYSGTLYLMCCVCEEICSEQDDFFNHDCNNVKPKPVPVLVSKNAVKPNNVKHTNGPTVINKDVTKSSYDAKLDMKNMNIYKNDKYDTISTFVNKEKSDPSPIEKTASADTSGSFESSHLNSKVLSNTIDPELELDSPSAKHTSSPTTESPQRCFDDIPNGDDSNDNSEESDSGEKEESQVMEPEKGSPEQHFSPTLQTPDKERECGIKLKLSLNNANSPVIINSTVDPTVGQQSHHKQPPRLRRPPKRYEKDKDMNDLKKIDPVVPKLPSIKMTICDKADSSFVKSTVFENINEPFNYQSKSSLNNNLDTCSKTPEYKPENKIKSTIYDNKLEDINTLNRVPKLTVRVPKELLDKDSSSDYSSDSDVSDKLTVDENSVTIHEEKEKITESIPEQDTISLPIDTVACVKEEEPKEEKVQIPSENLDTKDEPEVDPNDETASNDTKTELKTDEPVATDESPVIELVLDKPIDRYPLKDLLKVFLTTTVFSCNYCNHVRKIAVNCENLSLHMAAQHKFRATVNSITAEELMPETIAAKVKAGAAELSSVFINLDSYDSIDKYEEIHFDQVFECFKCYFKTTIHKDLYLHNRKMHQKTILLCVMCKSNFYSYSELLCHLCPGAYDSEYEIKYRCCLCTVDTIPSSFRLMVHLRKTHHTCDVCLEFCHNQARLSNHVWKHKLHHLCYRCGIAYRNKPDITKHLFWKHGTESEMCKKCLQKKWPHVYHFCMPPASFVCDECSLQFSKAVYLKVHKRFHSNEFPHACTEEGCAEKFVSKKLLIKHVDEHNRKVAGENIKDDSLLTLIVQEDKEKEAIPIIDLVDDDKTKEVGATEVKTDQELEPPVTKKQKKKKNKDKDALLLDVNLPALNLSESDSSDESDSGLPQTKDEPALNKDEQKINSSDVDLKPELLADKLDGTVEVLDLVSDEQQQALDIWDNFKKYQAKVEKNKEKEKTPPLVPIRKHVCESDHDYCIIPTEINGDDTLGSEKKKNKKSPKKRRNGLSSSSSSSSDSDSSCSCGSNCSCSSSSGSSSSSSSDSDSSDDSGNDKKKNKSIKKSLPNRRISNGSNVDVMGMSETPVLVPEKVESPIAETDLETEESDTDEEFYDEHPQKLANKLHAEKRNQLLLLASVAPSDGGSVSGEVSRCTTPVKDHVKEPLTNEDEKEAIVNEKEAIPEVKEPSVKEKQPIAEEKEVTLEEKDEIIEEKLPLKEDDIKEKTNSSKKKSKKKKKSKSSRKHGPIKINIPKEVITKSEVVPVPTTTLIPNKITISLQSNTVQLPTASEPISSTAVSSTPKVITDKKRASKRRRVPNKFYGYSSDEDTPQALAMKPQQPPKLEWRKEDLPSPVTHKPKKEVPSSTLPNRLYNYHIEQTIRLTAPIPDPEPPRILMNSESMESSESESSEEGGLEILQTNSTSNPLPPPTYLNSGTSSLPYAFQRPAVRQAREGESVYCYCRCPYDEVSEMIACDAEGCAIEWFHFECVGIMVPPKGKWYCPECRKNQSFSGYR